MRKEMIRRLKELLKEKGVTELSLSIPEMYGHNFTRFTEEGVFYTFRSDPEAIMTWEFIKQPVLVKVFQQFFNEKFADM